MVAHNPDVQEIVGFVTRSGRSDEASQLQVQLWFPLWLGAATTGSSCSYPLPVTSRMIDEVCFRLEFELASPKNLRSHPETEALLGSSSTATFMGGDLVPEKTLPRTSR